MKEHIYWFHRGTTHLQSFVFDFKVRLNQCTFALIIFPVVRLSTMVAMLVWQNIKLLMENSWRFNS